MFEVLYFFFLKDLPLVQVRICWEEFSSVMVVCFVLRALGLCVGYGDFVLKESLYFIEGFFREGFVEMVRVRQLHDGMFFVLDEGGCDFGFKFLVFFLHEAYLNGSWRGHYGGSLNFGNQSVSSFIYITGSECRRVERISYCIQKSFGGDGFLLS